MYSKLQALEMSFLRCITGNRRNDHVSNESIRDVLKVEPLLVRIERSQIKWFGHIARMDASRVPYRLLFAAKSVGRRVRGRPRLNHTQNIELLLDRVDLSLEEAVDLAIVTEADLYGRVDSLEHMDP